MKKILSFVTILFYYIFSCNASIIYTAPDGKSSNDGSSFESPKDLISAISGAKAGDTIYLQASTYFIPYQEGLSNTLKLSVSGNENQPISIIAFDGQAVIDFSFPEQVWVQSSYGFHLTGSYWYFRGIDITNAGYQGVYVEGSHNTFEKCNFYRNRNTGLEINKGGSYTTVINCDSYQNYDPKKLGSMADGFGPKQTQGPGNRFIGCRAWENSDDGYDCYDSPEKVSFENCWAFRNGVDIWNYGGFSGNGNGFKLGGNRAVANNEAVHCVSFGHPGKGFDQNNNAGGITIYNCTGYANYTNFGFGNSLDTGQQHIIKNNISLQGSNSISNAAEMNNTWNNGFSVSSDDFVSIDTTQAAVNRNTDGSIAVTDLFFLETTSKLIDVGIDVGLPFNGKAPDLGYHESDYTAGIIDNKIQAYNFQISPNPARDITNLMFCLTNPGTILIHIYSQDGKLVDSFEYQSNNSINKIEYNIRKIKPGIYICKISGIEDVLIQRFIVAY